MADILVLGGGGAVGVPLESKAGPSYGVAVEFLLERIALMVQNLAAARMIGHPTDINTVRNPPRFTLGPTLVSTTIRTETEKLICPFETLISNIGGTLGLFLGFSFFMLWDWFEFAWNSFLLIKA